MRRWRCTNELPVHVEAASGPIVLYDDYATLERVAVALRDALAKARRNHYECEDSWYACPKSSTGCANDSAGEDCDCGADMMNAMIDAALSQAATLEKQKGTK